MTDLMPRTPGAGLLPVSVGGFDLQEINLGPLYLVTPFKGQTEATSARLQKDLGIGFPKPNERVRGQDVQSIWFGRDAALLAGVSNPPELSGLAAVTDQSDAWIAVSLSGAGSEDVLARLVPLDLRPASFGSAHTARSLIGHMTASISRTGPDSFLILVFRSMAGTLVHELKEAMEALAARG